MQRYILVIIVLGLWFALIGTLGTIGFFIPEPGQPSWYLYTALSLPIALFLGAYFVSPAVKKWVQHIDSFLVTLFQAWRVVGFCFIPLAVYGILAKGFAYPAGFGDILIGFAAVYVIYQLKQHDTFISSDTFRWFHYAGLLDFVVAIATNTYFGQLYPELNAVIFICPLVLIPTFFVPFFIICHIIALIHHQRIKLAH